MTEINHQLHRELTIELSEELSRGLISTLHGVLHHGLWAELARERYNELNVGLDRELIIHTYND